MKVRGNDAELKEPIIESAARARLIEPLTARELQLLELVCNGYSNHEISGLVGI
ncbi:LuxR C-terminal-related transcriptional regulator [Nevskia ramosa]|uniref:LuxR C-terminal-related transcriptional regulator n=1 Tax=Nevskia ramosa TaxID=64002 RepID=UPI00344E1879